jgi:hypothetical protein
MTAPAELPIVGKMQFKHTAKEDLLEFWQQAERKAGLKINYRERVESIQKSNDGTFAVKTQKQTYRAASVLLAIGPRGTPRKLGVPGEELPLADARAAITDHRTLRLRRRRTPRADCRDRVVWRCLDWLLFGVFFAESCYLARNRRNCAFRRFGLMRCATGYLLPWGSAGEVDWYPNDRILCLHHLRRNRRRCPW